MSRLKAALRAKLRVLFVCIGNSCRSPMAEGFARKYGADVIEAHSAGLAPASFVAETTKTVMAARGVDLSTAFPKSVFEAPGSWDIVVNMSGERLPDGIRAHQSREWKVPDPIGLPQPIYEQVAALIETHVMKLIIELRN